MTEIATNKKLIFTGEDLINPRMAVESKKMNKFFPQIRFYASGGTVTSVQGYLKTSYGNSYYIKIAISSEYPYEKPTITLPNTTIKAGCPHKFVNDTICVMKAEQWSSTYSLAFMVAKTALWVNKYDLWQRKGYWAGKGQPH